jgi:hypothetical protein
VGLFLVGRDRVVDAVDGGTSQEVRAEGFGGLLEVGGHQVVLRIVERDEGAAGRVAPVVVRPHRGEADVEGLAGSDDGLHLLVVTAPVEGHELERGVEALALDVLAGLGFHLGDILRRPVADDVPGELVRSAAGLAGALLLPGRPDGRAGQNHGDGQRRQNDLFHAESSLFSRNIRTPPRGAPLPRYVRSLFDRSGGSIKELTFVHSLIDPIVMPFTKKRWKKG